MEPDPKDTQLFDEQAYSGKDSGLRPTVSYRAITPLAGSGRYAPERFHARGGMGEVWLAEDGEIGRQVALKMLRKKREEYQERFLAEAQITGQLEHPCIVPVHDLGLDKEGHAYYVMKFVQGRTLSDVISDFYSGSSEQAADREVAWRRLLEAFVDVCEAVAYAHSRGVVHRDLKPDNVMLGDYGETLVVDWGLAKVLHQPEMPGLPSHVSLTGSGKTSETQLGSVMGTPAYMSPEMASGRAAEAGPATDVYLLGGTLYSILTGRAPRRGSSHEEMVELARTVPSPPPRQFNHAVARPLEAVCLKALARREADRYQGAQDLAEDVRRYLAGEPVSAYPEGWLARSWRWAKRHRRGLARVAAAALLVGAVSFGFAMWKKANWLEKLEVARGQISEFRHDADGAFYVATSSNAPDEKFPYYHLGEGRQLGEKALATASLWGSQLEQLPLEPERGPLKNDLCDLLLLKVQIQSGQSPTADDAKEMLAHLDHAALLREPTRTFYRLRSLCYQLVGDPSKAGEAARLAEDARTPWSAVDHFLLAEHYRTSPVERDANADPLAPPAPVNLGPAIDQYRAALRCDRNHFWSRLQLGRCYLSVGRSAEAVETLDACVALQPESPWGYSAPGLALAAEHRYDDAVEDLNQVLAMRPDLYPAKLNRGWVHWKQGEEDQAIADFKEVIESPERKGLAQAAYYLGNVYLRQAHYAEAANCFQQFADDVTPSDPAARIVSEAYRGLASAHYLLGDAYAGAQDLNRFLELKSAGPFDPRSPTACYHRGRFLLRRLAMKDAATELRAETRKKILQQALAEFQQAETGRAWADLYYEMGLVLEKLRRFKEAIAVYSQGLELAPGNLKLLNKRGYAYTVLGQYDLALADYAQGARAAPQDLNERILLPEAHTWLGYFQALQENDRAAEREAACALLALRDVDRDQKEVYKILHNLACIYGQLSESDDEQRTAQQDLALALLGRALDLAELHDEAAAERGNIQQEEAFGPRLRARKEFQQLVQQRND